MSLLKNITRHGDKVISKWSEKMCKLFGHRWLYKDYSNYIQADGSKYAFKASRTCTRCNLHAYYYTGWKVEAKSKIDYEGDYYGMRKIEINKVIYS